MRLEDTLIKILQSNVPVRGEAPSERLSLGDEPLRRDLQTHAARYVAIQATSSASRDSTTGLNRP